jgi:hypothetical protein
MVGIIVYGVVALAIVSVVVVVVASRVLPDKRKRSNRPDAG